MADKIHPLIAYAKKARKSLNSIAKDAGCSRMTLYRVMKGENTTVDVLQRISAATDGAVKLAQLLPRQAA